MTHMAIIYYINSEFYIVHTDCDKGYLGWTTSGVYQAHSQGEEGIITSITYSKKGHLIVSSLDCMHQKLSSWHKSIISYSFL